MGTESRNYNFRDHYMRPFYFLNAFVFLFTRSFMQLKIWHTTCVDHCSSCLLILTCEYFTVWQCVGLGCKHLQVASVFQHVTLLPYMTLWLGIYIPYNKREKSSSIILPLYRDIVSHLQLHIICSHFSLFDHASLKEIKEYLLPSSPVPGGTFVVRRVLSFPP